MKDETEIFEIDNETKVIALLSGFYRELNEGKKDYLELNYEYAKQITALFTPSDEELNN